MPGFSGQSFFVKRERPARRERARGKAQIKPSRQQFAQGPQNGNGDQGGLLTWLKKMWLWLAAGALIFLMIFQSGKEDKKRMARVRAARKKKSSGTRKPRKRTGKKKTQAELKKIRLKNLAKGRRKAAANRRKK